MLGQAKLEPAKIEVTGTEHRAHAIFSRVNEIDNCLRSLRIAITGLQAEANSSKPDVEEYRYHAENYLLRLTGLYDRACRFAGAAINMTADQVDRQSGNAQVLKSLKSSGQQKAVALLHELKTLLEPHWDNRNIVAHAGEYSSRQICLFAIAPQIKLDSVNPNELNELMNSHFKDSALDFGVMTLQAEGLLYSLIETLASAISCATEKQ
jgi:hypothetical protein